MQNQPRSRNDIETQQKFQTSSLINKVITSLAGSNYRFVHTQERVHRLKTVTIELVESMGQDIR